MIIPTTAKIKSSSKTALDKVPGKANLYLWRVTYEIHGDKVQGHITSVYLIHPLDEYIQPELIRGFSEFEGIIDGKYGKFTAQEDGLFQENLFRLTGRIIDAKGDLNQIVGRFTINGERSDEVYELEFDIDL